MLDSLFSSTRARVAPLCTQSTHTNISHELRPRLACELLRLSSGRSAAALRARCAVDAHSVARRQLMLLLI